MRYLGITGEKRSGKSTLARGIQEAISEAPHIEISDIVTEVATDFRKGYIKTAGSDVNRINHWLAALPPILKARISLDSTRKDFALSEQAIRDNPSRYQAILGYLHKIDDKPQLLHEPITHETKENHRELLQALGGAVVGVKPSAWFEEAFRRIERSDNPAATLGIISTVAFASDAEYVRSRGGTIAKVVRPEQQTAEPQLDPTDAERSSIEADILIINDGNYEQLLAAGKQVVTFVHHQDLAQTIICSKL